MRTTVRNTVLSLIAAAGLGALPAMAAPPETGFTFQGALDESGDHVDTPRDFRFRLYDAATGGTLIATQQRFAVGIEDGVFTTDIDFGAAAYATNQSLWLEIEVGPADFSQSYTLLGRQPLTATPFSLNTRGMTVSSAGQIEFGADGLGNTPSGSTIQISSPANNPGIIFNMGNGSGGLFKRWDMLVDSSGSFQLRVNNPVTSRIVIDPDGEVGLGTATPQAPLDVLFDGSTGIEVNDSSAGSSGIGVQSTVGIGTGVRGESTATSGSNSYGVYGQTASISGWGVYSNGRLGASGTKSFMIDHPMDPTGQYLLHYSSESPDPQNRYNGNAVLDGSGRAEVRLPHYYELINTDPRYTLTPIGSPGPNLYIATEIENNAFVIAGGTPGQKVSWEVVSKRNDAFVRQRGAPTEVQKVGSERGRLLMPSLYGEPASRGIHYVEPARVGPPASSQR